MIQLNANINLHAIFYLKVLEAIPNTALKSITADTFQRSRVEIALFTIIYQVWYYLIHRLQRYREVALKAL